MIFLIFVVPAILAKPHIKPSNVIFILTDDLDYTMNGMVRI